MNFDMNTLSALMQAFASQPRKNVTDVKSPFASQNGLGERINLSEPQGADVKPLANLTDMLSGKGKDMASIMSMLMPRMGKQEQAVNPSTKDAESKCSTPKKLFGDSIFAPINFAGYYAVSLLNILYHTNKR